MSKTSTFAERASVVVIQKYNPEKIKYRLGDAVPVNRCGNRNKMLTKAFDLELETLPPEYKTLAAALLSIVKY